jgi:hypothetical protein
MLFYGVGVMVGVDVTVDVDVRVGVDVEVLVCVIEGVTLGVNVGVKVEVGGGDPCRRICGLSQMASSSLGEPFECTTKMNLTVSPARLLKSRFTG